MSTYDKGQLILDALKVAGQEMAKALHQADKKVSDDSVKFWEGVLETTDAKVLSIIEIGAEFGWSKDILLTYLEGVIQSEKDQAQTLKDRLVNIL
jgi:hypothetical protein